LTSPAQGEAGEGFSKCPTPHLFQKHGLEKAEAYLLANPPKEASECFVHGDCHCASVLWEGGSVSAALDYEISGTGMREFDLAWALVLRPGQKFLKKRRSGNASFRGTPKTSAFPMPALVHLLLPVSSRFFLWDEACRQEPRKIMDETVLRQSLWLPDFSCRPAASNSDKNGTNT